MKALLVVDAQNDFCPEGALAVENGDRVIPVINRLMDQFDIVIASKDWHPKKSVHFKKWPSHCIQNTKGAEFHPLMNTERIQKIFLKGTEGKDDGYSAFEATNHDLESYLKNADVNKLYVAGLATDYCVKATALDAVKKGFETYVILDATEAVDGPEGKARSIQELNDHGVNIIKSSNI